MYHPVEGQANAYRIVRFAVQPHSIRYEFRVNDEEQSLLPKTASIQNPIASCQPGSQEHTTAKMIQERDDPQPASGTVLFTYDVTWIVNPDVPWASRWNIYLDTISANGIHWVPIRISLIWLVLLTSVIAAILVRHLQRVMDPYDRLEVLDKAKEQQEHQERINDDDAVNADQIHGWRLLHADVFRPPSHPKVLAVACGTGAQILCSSFCTIFFGLFGFMSPARRGHLLTVGLFVFAVFGCLGGYVTARLYKAFQGNQYQRATLWTALGFPSLVFGVFIVVNIMARLHESTFAIPISTHVILLIWWFGIMTPLVFVGARFGYRQESFEFPVSTNFIRRPIPSQPWFLWVPCTMAIGGILPYYSCHVELHLMQAHALSGLYYYHSFEFLMWVFVIALVTCAEVTILLNYWQLGRKNYHWWWRSFTNAGSAALFVFLWSLNYFHTTIRDSQFSAHVIWVGYMAVVCVGLFCLLGFVGVAASLYFNCVIFASLRQELQAKATDSSGTSWGQENDLETIDDNESGIALRTRTSQASEESFQ